MENKAKIIGFLNQKGGVGKTTQTVIACTALSMPPYEYKCALIDCDPQESAIDQREQDIAEIAFDVAKTNSIKKVIGKEKGNLTPEQEAEVEELVVESYKSIREKIAADKKTIFPYPIYYTEFDELPQLIVDLEDKYDYIFIDMPGQAQGDGLGALVMLIDYAFIPVYSGNFDLTSSVKFIQQKLFQFQHLKRSRYQQQLHLNVIFNKVKPTLRYRVAIDSFKQNFHEDERINILDPEDCLTDNVFFEESVSTYKTILTAPAPDKSRKKARELASRFIDNVVNIVTNE